MSIVASHSLFSPAGIVFVRAKEARNLSADFTNTENSYCQSSTSFQTEVLDEWVRRSIDESNKRRGQIYDVPRNFFLTTKF